MYLNLAYILYFCSVEPWQPRVYNRLELINEWFIALATIQLVMFSDFVADVELKTTLGWVLISTLSIGFFINIFMVMQDASHMCWLYGKYVWVRCVKCCPSRKTTQEVQLSKVEPSEFTEDQPDRTS